MQIRRTQACVVCCLLLIPGCVTLYKEPHPETMKASGFNSRTVYVHRGQLKEDMVSMMQGVTTIMSLETDESINDIQRQVRILRELKMIENAARVIKNGTEIVGYTLSNPYMGSFLHDIQMAREFAELDPPDYQPSVDLFESCVYCHQHR